MSFCFFFHLVIGDRDRFTKIEFDNEHQCLPRLPNEYDPIYNYGWLLYQIWSRTINGRKQIKFG